MEQEGDEQYKTIVLNWECPPCISVATRSEWKEACTAPAVAVSIDASIANQEESDWEHSWQGWRSSGDWETLSRSSVSPLSRGVHSRGQCSWILWVRAWPRNGCHWTSVLYALCWMCAVSLLARCWWGRGASSTQYKKMGSVSSSQSTCSLSVAILPAQGVSSLWHVMCSLWSSSWGLMGGVGLGRRCASIYFLITTHQTSKLELNVFISEFTNFDFSFCKLQMSSVFLDDH